MIPGRLFNVGPAIRSNQSLGELQADQAAERGEFRQPQPFGTVPPAASAVPAYGTNQGTLSAGENQSNWGRVPFTANIASQKVQDTLYRKFMLLMNLHPTETLYFGFGWEPDTTFSLTLTAGQGFEPFRYPTNEIFVSASANGVQGIIIFGV